MNKREEQWVKELKAVLKRMPKGLEVIVDGFHRISIYPVGTMAKHLGSDDDGAGIMQPALDSFRAEGVYPYSEGG